MGTIATRVELTDGISHVARNITHALKLMNNNLRAAQVASGQAMEVHKFREVDRLTREINSQLDAIEQNYEELNNQQNKYNKSLQQGVNNASSLFSKVKNLMGVYAGMQGVLSLVNVSDNMSSNAARLNLVGEQYSETDTSASLKSIYAASQNSRGNYSDFIGSVSKLGLTAGSKFSGTDDITRFVELVNKNLVVGGASTQEQASATYQLTQAMASGRLQGDEYRSIIENAPLLAKAIEDYMINVEGASGTMKEWAADGLLTAEVIKNAVYNSADEVEARFNAMPYTWSQVMTSIKNEANLALSPVLKVIGSLAQNWQIVRGTLIVVTAAIVAYKVAQMAANIQSAAGAAKALGYSGAKSYLIGTTSVLTGKTVEQTVAQHALNTAMLSSPVFWIVGGFLALVGVMSTASASIDTTTESISGMTNEVKDYSKEYRAVMDRINVKDQSSYIEAERAKALYSTMDNLLNKTYLTVEETNQLKSAYDQLCEIIPSIEDIDLSSPVEDLNRELKEAVDNFYELAVANAHFNVYSEKLEEAIRQKIDLNQAYDKAQKNMVDSARSASEKGVGGATYTVIDKTMYDPNKYDGYMSVSEYKKMFPDSPVEYDPYVVVAYSGNDMYKMTSQYAQEMQSINDALVTVKADIDLYISQMQQYSEESKKFQTEYGDSLGKLVENTEKTVEELEFLRDLAERDAINRFTTAEVKIDMSGMTNRIDSDADFDGFIGLLTNGLEEALAIAAERAEVR